MSKYEVNNSSIESILSWIKNGEIAIPEIQRPFVWDGAKVRDLIDSLYNNYPVGYIITWKNPDVKLKDGTIASGKKVLIDGQQRITALTASIVGREVIGSNYKKKRIKIAFNPIDEKFEVSNPAIEKDLVWISDIAEIFKIEFSERKFLRNYFNKNNFDNEDLEDKIAENISKLRLIKNNNIGIIELSHKLDIETVQKYLLELILKVLYFHKLILLCQKYLQMIFMVVM